jgi:hypothetical protein
MNAGFFGRDWDVLKLQFQEMRTPNYCVKSDSPETNGRWLAGSARRKPQNLKSQSAQR